MEQRQVRILVLLFVFYIMAACSMIKQTAEDVADMGPKEKVVWMMGVYNNQYDDYLQKSLIPDLTEEEKSILRKKKEVLTTVYPLIITYDLFQNRGEPISQEAEATIFGLLSQLQHLTVQKIAE